MKKLIALTAVAVCGIAFADDCTWTGLGQTAAWSDARNWSKTPEEGDCAIFPSTLGDKIVKFVPEDLATAGLFAGFAIGEGVTLYYSGTTTYTMTQNLSGSGKFLADGNGGLNIRCNNVNFTGDFVFTNKNVVIQSNTYVFGKTNRVFFTSSGSDYRLRFPDVFTYPAQGVFSNEFHFVSTGSYRQGITRNDRVASGIDFNGPVYLTGRGMFNVGTPTAYGYRFNGGLYGTGVLQADGGSTADNPVFCVTGRGGEIGGVTMYSGAVGIKAPLKTPYYDAGGNGAGVKFYYENSSDAAAEWSFDRFREYDSGGLFDLNGCNQTCGDIFTAFSKNETQGNNVIKSATSATLTCTGSSYDPGNWNHFRGRLQGAVTFVYAYDPIVHPTKPSSRTGTLGSFTLNGAGSDTAGGLIASNGTLTVGATATFSNLTVLAAVNTGVLNVRTSDIGNAGTGLAVKVADSGTMEIAADVTVAAKTAFVGKWLEPGDYTKNSPGLSNYLTGDGTLTVSEYGGPKGLMLILR